MIPSRRVFPIIASPGKFDNIFSRKKDERGRIESTEVIVFMIAASVWLMVGSILYSLQLQSGSFPKPMTAQEEKYYLEKAAQGDLQARNVLIERNLRLVAHIMKKG